MRKDVESSSLAEVIDRILCRGLIIDAYVRVSLLGIELLTVDLRVVVSGIEPFLRYAEAVGLTTREHYPDF